MRILWFAMVALLLTSATAAHADSVTDLILINADTNTELGSLVDGGTLNLASYPTNNFNVKAVTDPVVVGSVVFESNGSTHIETAPPYALEGDVSGDYLPWTPNFGPLSITATPYTSGGGNGTAGTPLTVNLTVVDDSSTVPPTADAGGDRVVFLPDTGITLIGSAITPSGTITDYAWDQTAGASVSLSGQSTASLNVSGLAEGSYEFRLVVTDSRGLSDVDLAAVTVLPEGASQGTISGELRKWHRVTVTFQGPSTNEGAGSNPFRDHRMNVTFVHESSGKTFVVPGFFAADGDAANTGANSGDKWRVHFSPPLVGRWNYGVSFRTGSDVAVSLDPQAGTPDALDGATGVFDIGATNKTAPDLRAKGRLDYVGEHYLRFAETGDYYIKGGANSPENFLGYYEFDNTTDNGGQQNALVNGLHRYQAHESDWNNGDPTWDGGKGKGIIGAVNYLSSMGMNTIYFLTMNVAGDGREVYPWTSYGERYRFDVSKLEQWEMVFSQMTSKGIMLHVLQQERENDRILDSGNLGTQRKLYYRELIARFGHHPAITWNLGEENTNTETQRRAFADYIGALDPYDHFTVIHHWPDEADEVLRPLLGFDGIDGPSMQISFLSNIHNATRGWVDDSREAGRKWVCNMDEIGPYNVGVKPDEDDASHDRIRKEALWGNLMAGGAGAEWYFGSSFPHMDLDCEDWRTRHNMWAQTKHAIDFFTQHLPRPVVEFDPDDNLAAESDAWCFAKSGQVYVVYLQNGGSTDLDLRGINEDFVVEWYDPRNGGGLQDGTVTSITGGNWVSVGNPPSSTGSDWVALVTAQSLVAVAFQSVRAQSIPSGIELNWNVSLDDETLAGYRVIRRVDDGAGHIIAGSSTLLPPTDTTFVDEAVDGTQTYSYTVIAVTTGGVEVESFPVQLRFDGAPPAAMRLDQNVPNPFNPLTTIRFELSRSERAVLGVYDLKGRLIRLLVDADLPAGPHEADWNGTDAMGRRVASGVYVYRLQAGASARAQKMTLVQ